MPNELQIRLQFIIHGLFDGYATMGLSVCEITDLCLLELAKLNIAAIGDVEEGIAHLSGHLEHLVERSEALQNVELHALH